MARMRIVKPGFFTNEEIAELPPLTRLLFVGLWTVADRRGRLEDRPKRIKAELMPYDNHPIDAALNALSAAGFITRYTVDQKNYIQINKFEKHQHCHVKEPESTIPAPCETGANPSLTGTGTEQEHRGEPSLDSSPKEKIPYQTIIDHLNNRAGTKYRATSTDTREHISARWKEGATLEDFKRAIDNMVMKWKDDPKMCSYLRPSTLFAKGKFEGYVNQIVTKEREGERGPRDAAGRVLKVLR